MAKANSQRLASLWIFLAFAIWIYAFRGFLSSKLELSSDAISYYGHTKFFIENLGHGVYPLWDPFWCNGAPNDFFLRRIGAINPFYLFILPIKLIGIPYIISYFIFLAGYYGGGMVAFYLLSMRIYQDRLIAYAGYLILLFSALGTRLFDSYMMLITVPLIWFFYFLVAFFQTPRKHFFLGLVLSLMILVNTYIPFYFLIILFYFLFLYLLIYFKHLPQLALACRIFIKENKLLVILSLLVLIISLIPIISFFHNSSHGQVVFPIRHGNASVGQTLTVPQQTLDWGAVEDLMYSSYFSNLKLYKFAVVYVPFFSIIVFALGLSGSITRRAVFLFLLGVGLFCSIIPHGLPFYHFFYKHIFFLKYFRNLHFFIWFFLIPLFVILVLEHWKIFTDTLVKNTQDQWLSLLNVFFVHLLAVIFVWLRKDAVISTYLMIFSSLIFWSLLVLKYIRPNYSGYALLTFVILVQPLEAYHYLSLKAIHHVNPYEYDFSYKTLKLTNNDPINSEIKVFPKTPLYYAAGDYNFIYQNVSDKALTQYLHNKFILVDHVQMIDRQGADSSQFEDDFINNANEAIVFSNKAQGQILNGDDPNPFKRAQAITADTQTFKILHFDPNYLKLTINVPYRKFLIYNDSYDPQWRVSVNKQQTNLYEVNGAFKGVWIPAGQNIIEFHYGYWWQYAINILLTFFAFIILIGIIWYSRFVLIEG